MRAIRSYVGANSGPLTQRDHIFYAQRQDIDTDLRVHAIPSIMDLFDYSPAASGMTYYNDLNTNGLTIDGVPESPPPTMGPIVWQMATGAPGTVFMAGAVSTNIPNFAYTSYYEDNKTNPTTQCTGDAFAYGTSGIYANGIPGGIPCTDPALNCTDYLSAVSTVYYEPPFQTVSAAQRLYARANAPLVFVAQPWSAPVGGISEQPFPDQALASPSVSGTIVRLSVSAAMIGVVLLGAVLLLRRRRST